MDTLDITSLVAFNIVIAAFLYVALVLEIGQLREDIRRLAKRHAPRDDGCDRDRM